ncbi:hypothetical protein ACFQ36_06950 [Arthrobacter sp. GCM10027362]|uniref:hypothetical protein n=1 Tax=Arthrobacter sp. GCM10027362 TaxID=3273379 RepID=UPI0036343F17
MSTPCTMMAFGWSDVREDFLAEVEEVQVGDVAQVDAELDAVGVGDHQVPGVVLAQALDRELAADGFEGPEDGGPVNAVAKPELGVFGLPEPVLEDQIVRVDFLPALGAGSSEGFGEGFGEDFRDMASFGGGSSVSPLCPGPA